MSFRFLSIIIVLSFLLNGCKQKTENSDYQTFDLMKYGFPIEINAPIQSTFKKGASGQMSDLTIASDSDFNVQIFMNNAITTDIYKTKIAQRELVRNNPYFVKITEDYDDGFIFENKVDDKSIYDFKYVKIQGDKEFVFQAGIMGEFSEAQIKRMYEAISNK